MDRLPREVRRDVEVAAEPSAEGRRRVVDQEIAAAGLAERHHGVDEITVAGLDQRARIVVVAEVEEGADDGLDPVQLVSLDERVDAADVVASVEGAKIARQVLRDGGGDAQAGAVDRQRQPDRRRNDRLGRPGERGNQGEETREGDSDSFTKHG